jgi:hypothetical protein
MFNLEEERIRVRGDTTEEREGRRVEGRIFPEAHDARQKQVRRAW